GETAPYRLLAAAAQYAGRRRYTDLAALIRHPDLEDWLRSSSKRTGAAGSLADQLDQYYNQHLPNVIAAGDLFGNDGPWPDLESAVKRTEEWLDEAAASCSLRAWARVFREMLNGVYGQQGV